MASADYANIADLYDVYVNATFDIPYWLNQAQQHPGEILELMCGTGRVTLPLVEAGHQVTAVDNSPELLAILKEKVAQKGLAATIQQADVQHLNLGKRFNLILLPFNSFAEIQGREAQLEALQAIRQHLTPEGQFICTLHNPPVRLKSVDGQLRFVASYPLADGKLLFWIHQQYRQAEERVEVMQFYEEYDRSQTLRSKRMVELSFSLIQQAVFAELVQLAGFRILNLYGDYSQSPYQETESPFMIWFLGGA